MHGEPVHAERIVDGNSSALAVLKLFVSGTATERALGADEYFHITDVYIQLQAGGAFALVADAATDGLTVRRGVAAANGDVQANLHVPYVCPKGVVPKFSGAASGLNVCIVEGFITKA
jgi:hypothetical protein